MIASSFKGRRLVRRSSLKFDRIALIDEDLDLLFLVAKSCLKLFELFSQQLDARRRGLLVLGLLRELSLQHGELCGPFLELARDAVKDPDLVGLIFDLLSLFCQLSHLLLAVLLCSAQLRAQDMKLRIRVSQRRNLLADHLHKGLKVSILSEDVLFFFSRFFSDSRPDGLWPERGRGRVFESESTNLELVAR